jgi:hypothetical protein
VWKFGNAKLGYHHHCVSVTVVAPATILYWIYRRGGRAASVPRSSLAPVPISLIHGVAHTSSTHYCMLTFYKYDTMSYETIEEKATLIVTYRPDPMPPQPIPRFLERDDIVFRAQRVMEYLPQAAHSLVRSGDQLRKMSTSDPDHYEGTLGIVVKSGDSLYAFTAGHVLNQAADRDCMETGIAKASRSYQDTTAGWHLRRKMTGG